jgi:cytochrome c553
MKFTLVVVAATLCLFLSVAGRADAPAAYAPCAACHGGAGEGNPALQAPALAGQGSAYIQRQLANFRSGLRGGEASDAPGAQMRGMTATLSEADTPAVADWLASQVSPVVAPAEGADLRNGNNQYHARCGACHGGRAEGNPGLNAPALAFLDTDYLQRQFANFLSGVRGSDPQDTYGRQMKMMAATMPAEKDINDVIAYMQAQGARQ